MFIFRSKLGRFIIISLAFWIVSPTVCSGEQYCPRKDIHVVSVYGHPGANGRNQVQEWVVKAKADTRGWCTMEFLLADKGHEPFTIVTLLKGKQGGRKIAVEGPGLRPGDTYKDVMILSGYPAPCDVLPFEPVPGQRVYDTEREAGGRVFAQKYRIVTERVNLQKALENGWIRQKGISEDDTFYLISAFDSSGELVARQLWRLGADWWVYEENGPRRSWLLEDGK